MTDTLRITSSGPEVGNWQRFLVGMNVHDFEGVPISVDEVFGRRTAHGTKVYQAFRKLPETGFVDPLTRKAAIAEGFVPFIPAKNQTLFWPNTSRDINVIVVHTMQTPEVSTTAENVASWFGGRNPRYPAPRASAHFCVDSDSIVQCVRESDVAWGAPGANRNGLHVELAGFANQTPEQWEDKFSETMLRRAAWLVARMCREYRIPVTRLTTDELKAKGRGLCGHDTVSQAFKGSDHYDPGPWFPWQSFLAEVAERV
jgi:hypothetical protein